MAALQKAAGKPQQALRHKRKTASGDAGEVGGEPQVLRRSTRARAPPELLSGLPADWREREWAEEPEEEARRHRGRSAAGKASANSASSRAHYVVDSSEAAPAAPAAAVVCEEGAEGLQQRNDPRIKREPMEAIDVDQGASSRGDTDRGAGPTTSDSSRNLVVQTELLADVLGQRVMSPTWPHAWCASMAHRLLACGDLNL